MIPENTLSALGAPWRPFQLVDVFNDGAAVQDQIDATVAAPTAGELQVLVQQISDRIARHLERRGILVREAENSQLNLAPEESEDWRSFTATRLPTASSAQG
jgi:hypothetical protein